MPFYTYIVLFLIAVSYGAVGLGGGSAYLTLFSLFTTDPGVIRPLAWGLNIIPRLRGFRQLFSCRPFVSPIFSSADNWWCNWCWRWSVRSHRYHDLYLVVIGCDDSRSGQNDTAYIQNQSKTAIAKTEMGNLALRRLNRRYCFWSSGYWRWDNSRAACPDLSTGGH